MTTAVDAFRAGKGQGDSSRSVERLDSSRGVEAGSAR